MPSFFAQRSPSRAVVRPEVDDERTAIIDLGSNSFRLVVFATRDGWWRRVDEIYEPVRIGAGLDETGTLSREPIQRALAAVEVFASFCRASGLEADDIDVVATSAIRDATNRDEFLDAVTDASGLDVRELSMEEEAHYGYLAAVNSTTLADGAVLDLGGGSLQLVGVVGRLATELGSWPLGAVRMSERFLTSGEPATRKQLKALRAHVADELSGAPWLASTGRRLVALGGTARNLAAAAQRLRDTPSFGVQGYVIENDVLDELVELLAGMSVAERGGVPGIKPERGDLILAGAAAIQGVVAAGGFDGVEVTEAGLREGIFFERLLADSDPPLIDDVRARSVWNLAGQYGVDPEHTAHVARLALNLFDDLAAAGLHPGDAIERELLWSACTVHDIGVAVDYDDHHKHSRYLVLNGGLPGFSPREVALIGQAVRFHRKGTPNPGPFAALLREGDIAVLDRCATLLRLAEDLERSRDQNVRAVHVVLDGDDVRLELEADGDVSVPRWAAAREVDLFARAFGRRLVVV